MQIKTTKRIIERGTNLPRPGWHKENREELDKLHTIAIEDSMAASDPPSTIYPEVKRPPVISGKRIRGRAQK